MPWTTVQLIGITALSVSISDLALSAVVVTAAAGHDHRVRRRLARERIRVRPARAAALTTSRPEPDRVAAPERLPGAWWRLLAPVGAPAARPYRRRSASSAASAPPKNDSRHPTVAIRRSTFRNSYAPPGNLGRTDRCPSAPARFRTRTATSAAPNDSRARRWRRRTPPSSAGARLGIRSPLGVVRQIGRHRRRLEARNVHRRVACVEDHGVERVVQLRPDLELSTATRDGCSAPSRGRRWLIGASAHVVQARLDAQAVRLRPLERRGVELPRRVARAAACRDRRR